jgi:hypothetical protein
MKEHTSTTQETPQNIRTGSKKRIPAYVWAVIFALVGIATLYAVSAAPADTGTLSPTVVAPNSDSARNADLNDDDSVDVFDLSGLLSSWKDSGRPVSQGDADGNGTINVYDLSVVLSNWDTQGP